MVRLSDLSYVRHLFPAAIIEHPVWVYFRFTLSYRNVEDPCSSIITITATASFAAANQPGSPLKPAALTAQSCASVGGAAPSHPLS